jgi:hypothetical protein
VISLLDILLFAFLFFFFVILVELLVGMDAGDVDDIAFVSLLIFVLAISFIFLIVLWGDAIVF